MPAPLFSVVIPTRNRPDTLLHCLRTCVQQDFDDFEIVVCDNCGVPETAKVVRQFDDPRLRYIRAEKPLAMSDNWELAVGHARGEFIMVIGDDDGLAAGGLKELRRLIEWSKQPIVRWQKAFYSWPSIVVPTMRNYLRYPLSRECRVVDSHAQIRRVMRSETMYDTLPMIYNSAIHRDVLERLRSRVGRLFPSRLPDVYSAFSTAMIASEYLSTDRSITIEGVSRHSTGTSQFWSWRGSKVVREFEDLNRTNRFDAHPWVPDLPLFPSVPVADSFLIATETILASLDRPQGTRLPDDVYRQYGFERQRYLEHYVGGICAATADEFDAAMSAIRETVADNRQLRQWFDDYAETLRFQPRIAPDSGRPSVVGCSDGFVHVHTEEFGIANVAAAAELCSVVDQCLDADETPQHPWGTRLREICRIETTVRSQNGRKPPTFSGRVLRAIGTRWKQGLNRLRHHWPTRLASAD